MVKDSPSTSLLFLSFLLELTLYFEFYSDPTTPNWHMKR